MAKQLQPYHAGSKMTDIVKMACKSMKKGTCDGATPEPGTVSHTFGRLFTRPSNSDQPSKEQLKELAESMNAGSETVTEGTGEAGMAFIGQFIDHDLTLDATTMLGKAAGDVHNITNFRTPRLDLDSVYGGGSEVSPWLYDGPRLLFGREVGEGSPDTNPQDLTRNRVGTALIGDPRNDENLFLSQVHGRMFVAEHNRIVDETEGSAEHRFEHAREELTKMYHRLIVEGFLPQVVSKEILDPLLKNARDAGSNGQPYLSKQNNIDWSMAPDMPVEFSGAMFRFGHTWIRQFYHLNNNEGREAVAIFANAQDGDLVDLKGFDTVSAENNMLMSLFFGSTAQRAGRIDTKIPDALINLPAEVVGEGGERNLAFRNMERGQLTFDLPSGETVAAAMGFDLIEPDDRIKKLGLEGKTPLWFYALAEAEIDKRFLLHEVGGTIVAGVLLNLLLRAESSYFFAAQNSA